MWLQTLHEELKEAFDSENLTVVYFANLRGVPGFLRKMIKKKYQQDRSLWMLLDWKGLLATTSGFTKGALNVLIFDCSGDLVFRAAVTEVDGGVLSETVSALRTAVEDQQPGGDCF